MAGNDITLNIGANLTPAQRQLQAFVNQAQRQVGSQSFEFKLNDKGFRQPLGRITGDLNQFQGAMDASIARTLAFGASVGAIAGVTKAFKDMVAVTVKVEHALKEINVLLNLSTTDLSKFSKDLFGVAKNTASSFDSVAVAATEFSRQGLSAAETAKRVNAALILTRLSGLEAEASVSALTAAVNGFKREAVSTTEVVNRLANVDAAFAVSSADLAKALSRAGSVSQDAKVKFNELLAATTAVQQATARGGNVIGNGFKTIFTRLQRSKVREELEKIGVATTDSMGSMRGAIDILKDYARVYQTLSDQQKAYTSEQVAGVFQINTLKALVNDLSNEYGVYNRALQVANNTTNEAIQRNAELNKTLQSLASQTGTEIEQLAAKIGEISFEGNFKGILGFLKSALGDINSTLDSESFGGDLARGVLKGFGNFLTGPGLAIALVGMTKLLFFIGKQTSSALQQVLAIGSQGQKRQIVQTRINALLAEDNNLLRQIMSSSGNINDINKIVTRNINQQNAALANQKLLVNQIAAAFQLTKSGSIAAIGGGGGGGGRRGAEGFVPNLVRQERSSISRGVGGARGGDRPVILPNFNFGGGKSGTMVAHTGEHIVPNFAGGGSAIFNRNMASSMGLPAGAKRVGAAKGFVPNFYDPKNPNKDVDLTFDIPTNYTGDPKYGKPGKKMTFKGGSLRYAIDAGAITQKQVDDRGYKTEKQQRADQLKRAQKQLKAYDADKQGSRGAFMAVPGAGARVFSHVYDEARKLGAAKVKIVKGTAFGVNLNPGGTDAGAEEKRAIGQLADVEASLNKNITEAVNAVLTDVQKGGGLKAVPPSITSKQLMGGGKGSFLQKGGKGALAALKGGIFEGLINAVTKGVTGEGTKGSLGKGAKGKVAAQSELDIVLNDTNRPFLEALFNLPRKKYSAGDFKRRQSSSTTTSFSKQLLAAAELGVIGSTVTDMSPAQLQKLHDKDASKLVHDPQGLPGPRRRSAGGFVPSFANLAGMASSPAGKRAMATESALAGSARMGYDSRVGYGVFNHSQGSLTNAVSQHLSAGDAASSLSSMGAAAQAAVSAAIGFIPSFKLDPTGTRDADRALPIKKAQQVTRIQQKLINSSKALANAQNLTEKQTKMHISQIQKGTSIMKALGFEFKGLDNAAGDYTKALKASTKADRKRARQAKREKGGGMRALGVSMIGQQLVGVLSEVLGKRGDFESQYQSQQINRASTFAATGASVGAMSGIPGGMAIGAAGGVLMALATGATDSEKALQKFTFETDKAAAAQSQGNISLDNYLQQLSAYDQESDPSKKASKRNDLISALAKLPPEMASHFKGIGLDLKATMKIQQTIMKEQQKVAMVTAVKMANAMDAAAKSMNFAQTQAHGAKGLWQYLKGGDEYKGMSSDEKLTAIAQKLFLERMGTDAPEAEGLRRKVGVEMGSEGIKSEVGAELLARTQIKGAPGAGTMEQIAGVVGQALLQGDRKETQISKEKIARLSEEFDIETVGELFKTLGIEISQHASLTAKSGKKISELNSIMDRDVVPIIESAVTTMKNFSDIAPGGRGQTSMDIFKDFANSNAALVNTLKKMAKSLDRDVQTSKFLGAVEAINKSFITGLPSGVLSDSEKRDRISKIDRQKIDREGGLAGEKQNLKFYEEVEKARAAAAKEDPSSELAENLKKVQDLIAEGNTVEEILEKEALDYDRQTIELLRGQLSAIEDIKTATERQKDLQKLNNLRAKAMAEDARRQKTKDSIEGNKFNKELGFKLRSAVDRITGRGASAKTGGTNIMSQRLQAQDYEFIVSNFGDVLSKELKGLYEKEISGRRSFTAMAGLTDALAPGMRPRGQEFTGVQDYLGFLVPQLVDKLKDPSLSARDRERYKVLLDIARNTQKAYEISEERKAFEKARGNLRLKSVIGRGPTIQQGVGEEGMKAQARGFKAASDNLKAKLDKAAEIYAGGDKKKMRGQDSLLKAELTAIMGGTDADEQKVANMSRDDVVKALEEWNQKQIDAVGTINTQIKEMEESRKVTKDLAENTKKTADQLELLRGTIQNLIDNGVTLNTKDESEPKDKKDPTKDPANARGGAPADKGAAARGFVPTAARGGVADAFARERRDINNGVGGARPGIDQPRLINNFNGGPVVAHTGEFLVNNYNGGGQSAIFNRSMIGKMGMPAGAAPINAASGYGGSGGGYGGGGYGGGGYGGIRSYPGSISEKKFIDEIEGGGLGPPGSVWGGDGPPPNPGMIGRFPIPRPIDALRDIGILPPLKIPNVRPVPRDDLYPIETKPYDPFAIPKGGWPKVQPMPMIPPQGDQGPKGTSGTSGSGYEENLNPTGEEIEAALQQAGGPGAFTSPFNTTTPDGTVNKPTTEPTVENTWPSRPWANIPLTTPIIGQVGSPVGATSPDIRDYPGSVTEHDFLNQMYPQGPSWKGNDGRGEGQMLFRPGTDADGYPTSHKWEFDTMDNGEWEKKNVPLIHSQVINKMLESGFIDSETATNLLENPPGLDVFKFVKDAGEPTREDIAARIWGDTETDDLEAIIGVEGQDEHGVTSSVINEMVHIIRNQTGTHFRDPDESGDWDSIHEMVGGMDAINKAWFEAMHGKGGQYPTDIAKNNPSFDEEALDAFNAEEALSTAIMLLLNPQTAGIPNRAKGTYGGPSYADAIPSGGNYGGWAKRDESDANWLIRAFPGWRHGIDAVNKFENDPKTKPQLGLDGYPLPPMFSTPIGGQLGGGVSTPPRDTTAEDAAADEAERIRKFKEWLKTQDKRNKASGYIPNKAKGTYGGASGPTSSGIGTSPFEEYISYNMGPSQKDLDMQTGWDLLYPPKPAVGGFGPRWHPDIRERKPRPKPVPPNDPWRNTDGTPHGSGTPADKLRLRKEKEWPPVFPDGDPGRNRFGTLPNKAKGTYSGPSYVIGRTDPAKWGLANQGNASVPMMAPHALDFDKEFTATSISALGPSWEEVRVKNDAEASLQKDIAKWEDFGFEEGSWSPGGGKVSFHSDSQGPVKKAPYIPKTPSEIAQFIQDQEDKFFARTPTQIAEDEAAQAAHDARVLEVERRQDLPLNMMPDKGWDWWDENYPGVIYPKGGNFRPPFEDGTGGTQRWDDITPNKAKGTYSGPSYADAGNYGGKGKRDETNVPWFFKAIPGWRHGIDAVNEFENNNRDGSRPPGIWQDFEQEQIDKQDALDQLHQDIGPLPEDLLNTQTPEQKEQDRLDDFQIWLDKIDVRNANPPKKPPTDTIQGAIDQYPTETEKFLTENEDKLDFIHKGSVPRNEADSLHIRGFDDRFGGPRRILDKSGGAFGNTQVEKLEGSPGLGDEWWKKIGHMKDGQFVPNKAKGTYGGYVPNKADVKSEGQKLIEWRERIEAQMKAEEGEAMPPKLDPSRSLPGDQIIKSRLPLTRRFATDEVIITFSMLQESNPFEPGSPKWSEFQQRKRMIHEGEFSEQREEVKSAVQEQERERVFQQPGAIWSKGEDGNWRFSNPPPTTTIPHQGPLKPPIRQYPEDQDILDIWAENEKKRRLMEEFPPKYGGGSGGGHEDYGPYSGGYVPNKADPSPGSPEWLAAQKEKRRLRELELQALRDAIKNAKDPYDPEGRLEEANLQEEIAKWENVGFEEGTWAPKPPFGPTTPIPAPGQTAPGQTYPWMTPEQQAQANADNAQAIIDGMKDTPKGGTINKGGTKPFGSGGGTINKGGTKPFGENIKPFGGYGGYGGYDAYSGGYVPNKADPMWPIQEKNPFPPGTPRWDEFNKDKLLRNNWEAQERREAIVNPKEEIKSEGQKLTEWRERIEAQIKEDKAQAIIDGMAKPGGEKPTSPIATPQPLKPGDPDFVVDKPIVQPGDDVQITSSLLQGPNPFQPGNPQWNDFNNRKRILREAEMERQREKIRAEIKARAEWDAVAQPDAKWFKGEDGNWIFSNPPYPGSTTSPLLVPPMDRDAPIEWDSKGNPRGLGHFEDRRGFPIEWDSKGNPKYGGGGGGGGYGGYDAYSGGYVPNQALPLVGIGAAALFFGGMAAFVGKGGHESAYDERDKELAKKKAEKETDQAWAKHRADYMKKKMNSGGGMTQADVDAWNRQTPEKYWIKSFTKPRERSYPDTPFDDAAAIERGRLRGGDQETGRVLKEDEGLDYEGLMKRRGIKVHKGFDIDPMYVAPEKKRRLDKAGRPMGRGLLFGLGVDVIDPGPWATAKERDAASAQRYKKTLANMRKNASGLGSGFKNRMPSAFNKGGRGGFKSRRLPSAFNKKGAGGRLLNWRKGDKGFAGGYIPNMAMGPLEILAEKRRKLKKDKYYVPPNPKDTTFGGGLPDGGANFGMGPLEILAEKRKKLFDYKYEKGGLWDKQNPAMAPGGGGDTPIEQTRNVIAASKKKQAQHVADEVRRKEMSAMIDSGQLEEMRAGFSEKREAHKRGFEAKRQAVRRGESVVAPYQAQQGNSYIQSKDMIHPRTSNRPDMPGMLPGGPETYFERYKQKKLTPEDLQWRQDRATYRGDVDKSGLLSQSIRADLKNRDLVPGRDPIVKGVYKDPQNYHWTQEDLDSAKNRWADEETEEERRKRLRRWAPGFVSRSEGYIPNLSLGGINASKEFLNFSEGGVAAAAATAAPAGGGEMSPSVGAEGGALGERGIARAKASQEKHNVNVNIEVYGNVTDGTVDGIQSNSSDMATILEGLVNGGM